MSKVEAYICDCCEQLREAGGIVGINPIEDMFDRLRSFPTVTGAVAMSKTDVHYCTECYRSIVLTPAANTVDRKKDEEAYKRKVLELAYGLRSQTVRNHRDKHRFKK